MALLDNLFRVDTPEYMTGLLGEEAMGKLRDKALTTGLINTVVGYLAQPKNQRFGSPLPYLARAYTAGQTGAQGVYEDALKNWQMQQKLDELNREKTARASFEEAAKNLYTTVPAQYQEFTTPGGYAPAQTEIQAGQVAPNYGLTQLPDVTERVMTTPERQVMNPQALQKMLLSGDRRASDYLSGLKTLRELSATPERKTAVVGKTLVDTATGQVVYDAPSEAKARQTKEVDAGDRVLIVDSATGETVREIPKTQTVTSIQEFAEAQKNPAFARFLQERDKSKATQINLPSEGERTAGFLTNRVQTALDQINRVVTKNPNAAAPKLGAEAVKFFTGSDYFKTLANPAERQQIENAQLDLLDAALTLGTGAAYTREQLENYRRSYFPQLGESKKAIQDKQERLDALLRSARIKAGRAAPADVGLPAGVTVERVTK